MAWQRHSFNGANLFDTINMRPPFYFYYYYFFLFCFVSIQLSYEFTRWTKWIYICICVLAVDITVNSLDTGFFFNFTLIFSMWIFVRKRRKGKRKRRKRKRRKGWMITKWKFRQKTKKILLFVFLLRIARSCSYLNALNMPMSVCAPRSQLTACFHTNRIKWAYGLMSVCLYMNVYVRLLSSFDKLNYNTQSGIKIPWL